MPKFRVTYTKFRVTYTERWTRTAEVEAEDDDAAIEMVRHNFDLLGDLDFCGTISEEAEEI